MLFALSFATLLSHLLCSAWLLGFWVLACIFGDVEMWRCGNEGGVLCVSERERLCVKKSLHTPFIKGENEREGYNMSEQASKRVDE